MINGGYSRLGFSSRSIATDSREGGAGESSGNGGFRNREQGLHLLEKFVTQQLVDVASLFEEAMQAKCLSCLVPGRWVLPDFVECPGQPRMQPWIAWITLHGRCAPLDRLPSVGTVAVLLPSQSITTGQIVGCRPVVRIALDGVEARTNGLVREIGGGLAKTAPIYSQ